MVVIQRTFLNPKESWAFGALLSRHLEVGDLILLFGDLGAGKTTLARGIITRLTGYDDIPSPTYTLVQQYEADDGFTILHGDLYRIERGCEVDELGLDDGLEQGAVVLEWPECAPQWHLKDRLEIHFENAMNDVRTVRIFAFGNWIERLKCFDE